MPKPTSYFQNAIDYKEAIDRTIDKNRPLVLVSDIERYKDVTGTVDELVWLKDNGYTFLPDPQDLNRTWAIPPNTPKINRQIGDYQNGNGPDASTPDMLRWLDEIKTQVLKQRKAYAIDADLLSKNAGVLLKVGSTFREKEAYQAALAGYQQAAKLQPNNSLFAYMVGQAHLALGQNTEAKDTFLKAFKLIAANASVKNADIGFSNIGIALSQMGCAV